MTHERHLGEVERTLLLISEAEQRARTAWERLSKDGADPHFIAELKRSEEILADERRRLMQSTYFRPPSSQEQIAV